MPWVRATLRGKSILARVRATGELDIRDGRVEVRYNPRDGRLYRAAAPNVVVIDPTLLADDFCGPATPVETKRAALQAGAERPGGLRRPPEGAGGHGPELKPLAAGGALEAWTDGACTGNPGPAGLGIVLLDGPERTEVSEYLGQATNNIAELTAILRALQMTAPDRTFVVHTDSQYSIGVLQKGWKAKANVELIQEIKAALGARHATRLVYTPGHSGVALNERADKLARMAVANRASSIRRIGHKPGEAGGGE